MSEVDDAAGRLRLSCVEASERLIDALAVRGFTPVSSTTGTWRGRVQVGTGLGGEPRSTLIDVRIPGDYPYMQPTVVPLSLAAAENWTGAEQPGYFEASNSWHRETRGNLCLFEQSEHSKLPWADADMLLEQVQAWLDEDLAGWPNDLPALDLERYLQATGEIVLYGDLAGVIGKVVLLSRRAKSPWVVGMPARVPRGRKGQKGRWTPGIAMVLDLGEIERPIRNWSSLLEAAGPQERVLQREVEAGVRELVLLYSRLGQSGVLAVQLRRTDDGWTVNAHRAAPRDTEALLRRSHPQHALLAEHRVAIVGVGAIGSVIADLLHRSGVGHLHLIDPDVVLPGNLVRHLVGAEHVGRPKADAVIDTLRSSRPGSATTLTSGYDSLSSLDEAMAVFASADLVIDATADSTASGLIAAAARSGAGRAISVCVLADGYAIRVDHWPEPDDGPLRPPTLPEVAPGAYETGCSSPVSTTPPAAAWEAATLGARHAISVLLGANPSAGEERILTSSPGGPG
ncbi:ThiF family adenylyltransferase [Cellulomonas sp.]|uniref:ThiF family adenylyltransferase n=1 Tax=Cellulomonas sp. TaxID=40001 RepID=UPI003BAD6389